MLLQPGGNQDAPAQSCKMMLPHCPAKQDVGLFLIEPFCPVKIAFEEMGLLTGVTGLCKDPALNCNLFTDLTQAWTGHSDQRLLHAQATDTSRCTEVTPRGFVPTRELQ